MGMIIKMPMLNANDVSGDLIRWLVKEGDFVVTGDVICVIETTKSAFDVVSEGAGIFKPLVSVGGTYNVGHHIAFLADSVDDPVPDEVVNAEVPKSARWTKKAKILADKLNIDLTVLGNKYPGMLLTENMVKSYSDNGITSQAPNYSDVCDSNDLGKLPNAQRVLILGVAVERL